MKELADGALVSLSGIVSTASFADRFYAEPCTRISGIGVTGFSIPMGKFLTIEGHMATIDGERLISAYNVIQGEQANIPAPWLMNPNAIGGGNRGLQKGVSDWRLVKKWDDQGNPYFVRELISYGGTNNIGLLIKTTGRVSYVDDICFYLDGGGAFDDGRPNVAGIKVLRMPNVNYIPTINDYVVVTGISSCFSMDGVDGFVARLIRPVAVDIIPE